MATLTVDPVQPSDPAKQNGRDRLATTPGARAGLMPDAGLSKPEAPPPVHAVHTPNFPGLLRQLGASLLVTTY